MRVLVAVLLLLTCLGLAGTASASPRWRAVGTARELATDGARWAVWRSDGTTLHIADDRAARPAVLSLRPRCRRVDGLLAGGGRALVRCVADPATGATSYLTVDLAARSVTRVPMPATVAGETLAPLQIGRRWLEYEDRYGKGTARRYLDLASGEVVVVEGPTLAPDLSAPVVTRRLCRPLRRPENPDLRVADLPGALPQDGLVHRGGRWLAYAESARDGVELRAWRCGRARSRLLSRCPDQRSVCPEPQVGAGIATWPTARGLAVVRLRDRLEVRTVRAPRQVGRRHVAGHTGRWLYLGGTGTVLRRRR